MFREDPLAVDGDVEDPAAAAHEMALDAQLFLDLSRQTGGSRKIVSNAAVIDPDLQDGVAPGC